MDVGRPVPRAAGGKLRDSPFSFVSRSHARPGCGGHCHARGRLRQGRRRHQPDLRARLRRPRTGRGAGAAGVEQGPGADRARLAVDHRPLRHRGLLLHQPEAEAAVAFLPSKVVAQSVLAVYFDKNEKVERIANYGLKDGKVFDFISATTPTAGARRELPAAGAGRRRRHRRQPVRELAAPGPDWRRGSPRGAPQRGTCLAVQRGQRSASNATNPTSSASRTSGSKFRLVGT